MTDNTEQGPVMITPGGGAFPFAVVGELEQAEQKPVAKVIRNEAGQITMQKPDGNYFDISKHVGEYFYAAPVEPVKQEPVWSVEECDRVIKTLRYIQGIAERGFGRAMREDETIEQFVLGYVKQLEAATVPVTTPDVCGEVCARAKLCYGCNKDLEEANAKYAEQAEQEIIPSWEEYCECEGIPCEPVKPVDLTDDEIYEVCKDVPFVVIGPDYDLAIARAVIAKFKEKNK